MPSRVSVSHRARWVIGVTLVGSLLPTTAPAQEPLTDWRAVGTEAISTLQRYIRIDTSGPNGGLAKSADFLSSMLKRDGVDVTVYESETDRPIVVARLKGHGTAKPLLLLQHMDVVPVDGARWTHTPFGGDVADGNLWGRGAIDMKGPGVVQLMAFLLLKRQNVPLERDVILMATPDEEVGGAQGAGWMIKNHYDDIAPEYVLDEGGLGSQDLFAPGKLIFGISVAEKKLIWLKLRATGVAGHGSQPTDDNPNDRLTRALTRLIRTPMPTSSVDVVKTMQARVGPLADNKFNRAIQQSTIALTSLRSGVGDPPKVNVIPSVAEATLDCRVLPGTTREEWLSAVRSRLDDSSIEIEVISEQDDASVTTQDSPFYRALESSIKRRYQDAIVTPMIVPFTTDANKFRARGVHSYGFTPLVVPAAAVMSMHGDAEFVPTDALGAGIEILFEALKDTAGVHH